MAGRSAAGAALSGRGRAATVSCPLSRTIEVMIDEEFQQPPAPVAPALAPALAPAPAPAVAEGPRRWYPAALTSLGWHLLLLAGAVLVLGIGTDRSNEVWVFVFGVLVVPCLAISLVISLVLCLLVRSRYLAVLVFHGCWTTGAGLVGAVLVMAVVYNVWSGTRG